jgi:hypothetical protein
MTSPSSLEGGYGLCTAVLFASIRSSAPVTVVTESAVAEDASGKRRTCPDTPEQVLHDLAGGGSIAVVVGYERRKTGDDVK